MPTRYEYLLKRLVKSNIYAKTFGEYIINTQKKYKLKLGKGENNNGIPQGGLY